MLVQAQKHFKLVDPVLSSVADVLGEIDIRYRPANFEAFVRIIVNQQLSNKAANTIFGRIREFSFNKRLTPEILNQIGCKQLKECGLSKSKIEYILGLASHFMENPNYLSQLKMMNEDEVVKSLTSLRGIGIWSSNIFRLFNLRQQDIFPYGDVSLEKAIYLLYGIKMDKKYRGADELIALWSPYKSIASLYLWEWLDQGQPELSK